MTLAILLQIAILVEFVNLNLFYFPLVYTFLQAVSIKLFFWLKFRQKLLANVCYSLQFFQVEFVQFLLYFSAISSTHFCKRFPLHHFLLKLRKKIASKCLRVTCNPRHKWIECSENVCTMYRATLVDASWSVFCHAFRKNYAIWLKDPMLEDSLQWIGFVEFSTTNGTVYPTGFSLWMVVWFFLLISLWAIPHILNAWNRICECRYKYSNSVIRLIRGTCGTLHIKLALRRPFIALISGSLNHPNLAWESRIPTNMWSG